MLLYISIVVIFLSLILLFNNYQVNKSSIYICCGLIVLSIYSIVHHYVVYSKNVFWIAILAGHIVPFGYLIGPLLYFYIRNTLRGINKVKRYDYLHYLPFVVSFISIIPYYFVGFDTKLRLAKIIIDSPSNILTINYSWLYPSSLNILFRPLFIAVYVLFSSKLLIHHLKKRANSHKIIFNDDTVWNWLVIINIIFLIMALSYTHLSIDFFMGRFEKKDKIDTTILGQILFMLYALIPVLMLIFPQILYGLQKVRKKDKPMGIEQRTDHESLVSTAALILDFVKKEENLINPNFSIAQICKVLDLKNKDVLYCFKSILKTKFTTLKMEFRVELAKKELSSGNLISESMEGVWMKSGFTSKTSFFVSFKKVTGMTPLEYLKTIE